MNASILQGGYGQNNTVSIIMFHYPQVNGKVHFKVPFSKKKHTLYILKKFKFKKKLSLILSPKIQSTLFKTCVDLKRMCTQLMLSGMYQTCHLDQVVVV